MEQSKIIIWIALFIGLAGTFITRGKSLKADAEETGEVFLWSKFFAEQWDDLFLSLAAYVCVVAGASLGDIVPETSTMSVMGALVAGAGIPQIVSKWIMTIWGAGDRPRKNLRKANGHKVRKPTRYGGL